MDTRLGIVTDRRVGLLRPDSIVPVRILQVVLTDTGDVQNVMMMEQVGEETNPPNGSLVQLVAAGDGMKLTAGSADAVTPDDTLPVGGKRVYAVAEDNHTVMAEVRLLPDGMIQISNSKVTHAITPDGTVTTDNGAVTQVLSPDGTVTTGNGSGSFTMGADGVFTFSGTGTNFDHPVTIPELKTPSLTAPQGSALTITGTSVGIIETGG